MAVITTKLMIPVAVLMPMRSKVNTKAALVPISLHG